MKHNLDFAITWEPEKHCLAFRSQVLVQRCRDMQHPVFMRFIDFEKAFDMVKHVEMIRILQPGGNRR